jgi:formate hydrogenlyase transcriptional activator
VFPIRVPPLRERADDIPLLVRHFVQQFGRRMGKTIETIPSETMDALVRYHWPGNIRELQNVVERAVILTPGSVLNVAVGELTSRPTQSPAPGSGTQKDMQSVLDETERRHIIRALEETNWVIAGPNGAAARLGMNRSTLHARMQKLGVQITRSGPRSPLAVRRAASARISSPTQPGLIDRPGSDCERDRAPTERQRCLVFDTCH